MKLRTQVEPKSISFPDFEGYSFAAGDVAEGRNEEGDAYARFGDYTFVDPDYDQIKAISKLEIGRIEINTAKYCEALKPAQAAAEADKVAQCARTAAKLGLKVLAGHGLNYRNVRRIVEIPEIEELNIGH